MRRIITFISAVALAMGLLTGVASASDDPVLAELELAYENAQAEVDRLEQLVEDLEKELADAREELRLATADRAAKLLEIAGLEQALEDAEDDLLDAKAAQATIEGLLAGLGSNYRNGECNASGGNQAAKALCEQYLIDLSDAIADVAAMTLAVEDAEDALEVAEDELEVLEDRVKAAQDEVERIEGELEQAEIDLAAAEVIRDDALAALDAYVPPADAHAGCKGIENAQQQVAKNSNGKGKAAEALATVAEKFKCAA